MLNLKQINAAISGIARSQSSLRDKVHVVACSIVGHAINHGDVTPGTELLKALGSGARKQALVTWFETFGPFRLVKDENGAQVFNLQKEKRKEMLGETDGSAWCDALLKGETWYDYTPEPKAKSIYDVEAMVENILKAVANKAKKGEQVAHADMAQYLTKALKSYRIAQYTGDTPKQETSQVVEPVVVEPQLKAA